MRNYTTQMDAARKGIVTKEMEIVAKKEKEIKEDIDIKLTANLFTNIYLGTSHSGISKIKGYDINLIKKEFQFIYNTIKI